MSANPFQPYPKTRGSVKIFLYGDAGTEKTRRAMKLPKPLAIIDMEGGASDYQDLGDPTQDLYLPTRSVGDLEKALDWIEANPGKVATLIIDPITVLWQQLQQGHIARVLRRGFQKIGEAKIPVTEPEAVIFQVADWGKLKTHHSAILTRLMNLPCHVVWIARGGDKTNEKGNVVGYGWDGEKTLAFLAKVVVETRRDGDKVIKDRTGRYKDGEKISGRVDLAPFVASAGKAGIKMEREDDAAARDAAGNAASAKPETAPTSTTVPATAPREVIVEGAHRELRKLYDALAREAGANWGTPADWFVIERQLVGGGKVVSDLPKAKAEELVVKLKARTPRTVEWARNILTKAGLMPAKVA